MGKKKNRGGPSVQLQERGLYPGLPYCDRCGVRQVVHGTFGARPIPTGVELVQFGEICRYCVADLEAAGWELLGGWKHCS